VIKYIEEDDALQIESGSEQDEAQETKQIDSETYKN
jgi:hypothetical protein